MEYYLMAFKKYAEFNGRARRKEYWMFTLFNAIFSFAIGVVGGLISFEFLGSIYSLVVLIPSIALGVRRMHDVGKSGWFLLIPIYNLILAVTEGDRGENNYGPDPKASSMGEEALDSNL